MAEHIEQEEITVIIRTNERVIEKKFESVDEVAEWYKNFITQDSA